MRNCFVGSILVVGWLVFSPSIVAQAAQQSGISRATQDLSGIWNRTFARTASGIFSDDARGIPFLGFTKEEPPLQPEAREIYKINRQGIRDPRVKGRDEVDPSWSCFPPGPTRIFTEPRPFEIRQIPEAVYIVSEMDHWTRRIFLDGRRRPDGYPITWMGYSVGKYDGDILVVDTTGMNDRTWIDSLGTPHSDELHLVERFRRVNQDTLEIEFTFDDPKTYGKPWTGKKVYELQPPGSVIKEHIICEEHRKMGIRQGWEFLRE